MLIHADFVYIHFPKSGGSSIRALLKDCFGFELDRRYTHIPVSVLAEEVGARQVIGSLRDPFSWYESRLNYPLYRKRPLPFQDCEALDYIDQTVFIRGMADPEFLQRYADVYWRNPEFGMRPFEIMKRKRIGFLTFEFLFTYCRDLGLLMNDSPELEVDFETDLVPVHWVLTGQLEESFCRMAQDTGLLAGSGMTLAELQDFVAGHRRVNARPDGLRKTLSDEERGIIAEHDKPMFDFLARQVGGTG